MSYFLKHCSAHYPPGCDPNLLYEGRTQTVPNEALCDSPLSSISVEEGYACYIGTFVGASAVHHCLGCDDRVERVCLADGTWDGTIPQCDCKHMKLLVG